MSANIFLYVLSKKTLFHINTRYLKQKDKFVLSEADTSTN